MAGDAHESVRLAIPYARWSAIPSGLTRLLRQPVVGRLRVTWTWLAPEKLLVSERMDAQDPRKLAIDKLAAANALGMTVWRGDAGRKLARVDRAGRSVIYRVPNGTELAVAAVETVGTPIAHGLIGGPYSAWNAAAGHPYSAAELALVPVAGQ